MEGTENNKCLPADLWMSQIDPQFSGNLGGSALRDARTMSSATQLDLSRKQPPLYSDYDLSGVHYKQNAQAVTASTLQQFAPPSTRSAWEFAAENFCSTTKDFSPQSLVQPATTAGSRYSQSAHGYALEQNVSQSQGRHFAPSTMSQPHTGYAPENLPPQQSLRNFTPQDGQQAAREQTTHNLLQQNARTDRSVWSHLYSLDPSLASYSMPGQTTQNTNFSQDKPYSYTLPRTEGTGSSTMALKMSSVPAEKPPLILGKVTGADHLSPSYMGRCSLSADDDPISGLAPTLYSNVIGSTNVIKQKTSASYEDEIGGYSPVSPPTHDTSSSPFSDLPNDRSTALSMKSDNFMMSSNVSDFSSSSKALPVNEFMHSNPLVSDSNVSQFSHDVPLDMTKSWSSQNTDRATTALVTSSSDTHLGQPGSTYNSFSFGISKETMPNKRSDMSNFQFARNQPTPTTSANQVAANNSSNVFSGNEMKLNNTSSQSASEPSDLLSAHHFTNKPTDTLAVNQFVVSKSIDTSFANQCETVNESTDVANSSIDVRSINSLSNNKLADSSATNLVVSQESTETTFANHSIFSQRIAPKKSNFYGRDASFFSVPEVPDLHSSVSQADNVKNTIIPNVESFVSSSDVKLNPISVDTGSSARLTQTFCNTEVKVSVSSESLIPSKIELDSTSFADSFIDATTAPSPNSDDKLFVENQKFENLMVVENKGGSVNITPETKEENTGESSCNEVKAASDCHDFKIETNNQAATEVEPPTSMEEDPTMNFSLPNTLIIGRGGKARRGRKRRGGATQKRQTKKATKKAPFFEPDVVPGLGDEGVNMEAVPNLIIQPVVNEEPLPNFIIPPVQKPKARRGRKRSLVETVNPDSEGAMTRRSSSRRSKDNAMRLIELQAESIYGHISKPTVEEPPQQPSPKPRRKAAKAAVKSSTFTDNRDDELIEEKDVSSDEISDEKDADYAVDEEDVEAMEKDELLDVSKDQKKLVAEKRGGGLKISIKLGLDPSAEIVSGLDKSPPRKKRKVVKKKAISLKIKSKAIIQDDDLEEEDDDNKNVGDKSEPENNKSDTIHSDLKEKDKQLASEVEEKGNVVQKHNSLMDKYFSSATQARPVQKPVKKDNQLKKQDTSKSKSSKTVKGSNSKSNTVPSSNSSSDGTKPVTEAASTSDSGVPKFVCGYCPNRYHNKQELLSHMEAHMAEMEDKPNKTLDGDSAGSISKEPKKSLMSQSSKKMESGKSQLPKMNKKNEESEALKYNCGECGKFFSSKPNLLDHVRTHAAEKPFECNLCHKFFKERDQLSAHRKVHVQEGLLRCQFCQKGFVNNADLTSHMESHPKRTKSALLHSKQLVPDSVKKTTNLVSDSAKKGPNHVSDSSKKISKIQQISRDKEVVMSKPKSFASALEPSFEKAKDNPTLLLRRNDGSTSSSKDESLKTAKLSKTLVHSSKSVKEEIAKKFSSKAQDIRRESKDISNVKKETKDPSIIKKEPKVAKPGDQKPKNANETSTPVSVNKGEKDNGGAGECTCQECPECVTRFLNSFE